MRWSWASGAVAPKANKLTAYEDYKVKNQSLYSYFRLLRFLSYFLFNTLNFLCFRFVDTVAVFVKQHKIFFIIIQIDTLIITVFGLITTHRNGICEQCKILYDHEYRITLLPLRHLIFIYFTYNTPVPTAQRKQSVTFRVPRGQCYLGR